MATSETAVERQPCRLLDLPPELIQHSFSFVTNTDLPNLLLVSRDVYAQACGLFAKVYMERIDCFFLDPAQLVRFRKIAQNERSASRVDTVNLTLDPMGSAGFDDILLAPLEGQEMDAAQVSAWRAELQSQHCRFAETEPDWAKLYAALLALKALGCKFNVNLIGAGSHASNGRVAAQAWHWATTAGCNITDIWVTEEVASYLDNIRGYEGYSLPINLKGLHIEARVDASGAYDMAKGFNELARILSSLERLEIFYFTIQNNHTWPREQALSAQHDLLQAHTFVGLRSLMFDDLQIRAPDLHRVLSGCAAALTELELRTIAVITEKKGAWTELLSKVRALPVLSGMRVSQAMEWVGANHSDSDVEFPIKSGDEVKYVPSFDYTEQQEIEEALGFMVEHGLWYN